MSLASGTTLAHYEIVESIGKGGMDFPTPDQEKTFFIGIIVDSLFGVDHREGS